MIDKPGVYDIPAAEYHADCAPAPSLSASIAHVLLSQSPRHAWEAHPRLNSNYQAEHKAEFDIGHAVHAMLLHDERARFVIVEAGDYRSNAARIARDDAYAAGKIPLLARQYEQAVKMRQAALAQLDEHEARHVFSNGKPEQTIVWREGDVWCRSRLDWLPNDPPRGAIIPDLKSTTNAEPAAWSRSKLEAMGYDIQASFYLRGLRALGYPEGLRFAFVVVEVDPPHALSVVGLPPAVIALADAKVDHAIATWRHCLRTNVWPAYTRRIAWVDPQPWSEGRWAEKMARDETPSDAKAAAMAMQAPL